MKLRGQILLGTLVVALLAQMLAIRLIAADVEERLTALDTARADRQLALARQDFNSQSQDVAVRLEALAATMTADNRFRLAISGTRPDLASYLQDYASRQMSLMNLDLLQLQDDQGQVLSSGHFPGAHGEMEKRLPRLLARAPEHRALINARTASEPFLALGRTLAVTIGGQRLHLIGGHRIDAARLRSLDRDGDLELAVVWPEGFIATGDELASRLAPGTNVLEVEYHLRREGNIVRSDHLPLIWEGRLDNARLLVTHNRSGLQSLIRETQLHLILALAVAALLAALLASILAGRVSKPLRLLAAQTEGLDLNRLDVEFKSNRRDEVGHLTRLLHQMTVRLRADVTKLRRAEQHATRGEMARQVNHDIRNGITPLRNVLRHLSEVAQDDPAQLPTIFGERRQTLDDGLAYLEDLATHYARLSPGRTPEPCHLDEIIVAALADPAAGGEARLVNAVPSSLPPILADPVSLRRVFDNLVRNALEALPDGAGTITVDATIGEDPALAEPRILVSVSDTGEGIAPENIDAIFGDFFTTRSGGTGLGLSNVRRLIGDCGGTIRVQSEPGCGTTFALSFPLPETSTT